MPKKRPLTSIEHEELMKTARAAQAKLVEFRSRAYYYFHGRDFVSVRTAHLLEDFDVLLKELKAVAPK